MLTTREIAEALNVCPATTRRWTKEGRIPSIVISPRVIRYNLETVLKALSEQPVKGAPHA